MPTPTHARIRAAFKDSGMTQLELARHMGWRSKQAANQFLSARDWRLSVLKKFAKAVGVKVEELVG